MGLTWAGFSRAQGGSAGETTGTPGLKLLWPQPGNPRLTAQSGIFTPEVLNDMGRTTSFSIFCLHFHKVISWEGLELTAVMLFPRFPPVPVQREWLSPLTPVGGGAGPWPALCCPCWGHWAPGRFPPFSWLSLAKASVLGELQPFGHCGSSSGWLCDGEQWPSGLWWGLFRMILRIYIYYRPADACSLTSPYSHHSR